MGKDLFKKKLIKKTKTNPKELVVKGRHRTGKDF